MTVTTIFDYHFKSMESWVGMINLFSIVATIRLFFFRNHTPIQMVLNVTYNKKITKILLSTQPIQVYMSMVKLGTSHYMVVFEVNI